MKLKAILIKNFRSIVDTGWRNLAPDSITCLIGQNESGKTSILEALHSFHTTDITEDVVRSSGPMPKVACSFSVTAETLKSITGDKLLPNTVEKKILELERINLIRIWDKDMSSRIDLEEQSVINLYVQHEKDARNKKEAFFSKVEEAIAVIEEKRKEKNVAAQNKVEVEKALAVAETALNNENSSLAAVQDDEARKVASEKVEAATETLSIAKDSLAKAKERESDSAKIFDEFVANKQAVVAVAGARRKFAEAESKLKVAAADVQSKETSMEAIEDETQKEAAKTELDASRKTRDQAKRSCNNARSHLDHALDVLAKVFDGKSMDEAQQEIEAEQEMCGEFWDRQKFAEAVFKQTPEFEMFTNFSSLLPKQIDISALKNGSASISGYLGAKNFLTIAGLSVNDFDSPGTNKRVLEQQISNANEDVTASFQSFWQQVVGKSNKIELEVKLEHHDIGTEKKAGMPYLSFWVKDGREKLYPAQRSEGVRWFLSFFIQLKASAVESDGGSRVLLIDEPGNSLHAKAQLDVLKVLEDTRETVEVIYTTHSPHLLDLKRVYRILAVQRAEEEDDSSDTQVLTAHELGAANSNTMTPLYTLMGARFSGDGVITKDNNILLEEISAFYYMMAFMKLCNSKLKVSFLPATGASNLPQLANLFLGWGLGFIVVLDDDAGGREVYNKMKQTLCANDDNKAKKLLYKIRGRNGIEDIFTKTDFKKHVLRDDGANVTGNNSAYFKGHVESKGLMAMEFMLKVDSGELSKDELNAGTLAAIEGLLKQIGSMLDPREE